MSMSPVRIPVFILSGMLLLACGAEKTFESRDGLDTGAGMLHVPEGFAIERAVPPEMVAHPMFAEFDDSGRLFVIESSGSTTSTEQVLSAPDFRILLLEDVDGDGRYDRRTVYADSLPYPMGGTFHDGSFFAAVPPDLIRFTDGDGDGVADRREVILTGWTLNHNAATLSGPFFGPDGWLYMCDARRGFDITTRESTRLTGKGARIWRCRPDGTGLESVAGGGFDNTIELVFMPSGEMIGTMTYFTDPKDGLRDALMHWVEGGVYPKDHPSIAEDKLVMTGDLMPVMTELPRVSPSGLMRYRGTAFGEDYDGNLFSAEFNTGRIMRHTVSVSGATYTTDGAPFMVSDSLDVHPTDVLQDADGSLLVVNTGGWFIAGCPLSVVANADVHGGIFRIKKLDAHRVEDPWGHDINFEAMSPEKVADFYSDPRHAVRDKAIGHMIGAGASAIKPLRRLLMTSANAEVRAAVVFSLFRIDPSKNFPELLTASGDTSAMVRAAAARVLGMTGNAAALGRLTELLKDEAMHVRRQAATALGQIGDARAVPALLSAAEDPADRFIEHAIIYSLITLQKEDALAEALRHPSENVQRAALIALDQAYGSPIKERQVAPFLESESNALRSTAAWVAAHHPEWANMIAGFLKKQFQQERPSEQQKETVEHLVASMSQVPAVQRVISNELVDPAASEERKLFALELMSSSPLTDLPETWARALRKSLYDNHASVRSGVLEVVASRNVPGLQSELGEVIRDPSTPALIRMKAMGVSVAADPRIDDAHFRLLLHALDSGNGVSVRQMSAQLLAQADLTERQLVALAKEIATADAFLVPGLVNAFGGNTSTAAGQALLAALSVSSDRLEHLSLPDVEEILGAYSGSVQASARPMITSLRKRQDERLSRLRSMEAELGGGDVAEGRQLFYGKALCSSCHAVAGNGATFGPDLTNIGEIRSPHDILEAIVFPSASFAREYEPSEITTRTGVFTGIIKEQLPDIVLETGPSSSVRIAASDVARVEQHTISSMPAGLDKLLTTTELSSLMKYLTTLPDGMGHLRVKVHGAN